MVLVRKKHDYEVYRNNRAPAKKMRLPKEYPLRRVFTEFKSMTMCVGIRHATGEIAEIVENDVQVTLLSNVNDLGNKTTFNTKQNCNN